MTRSATLSLRIAASRLHQLVGWPGLAGFALLLAAATWAGLSWRHHRVFVETALQVPTRAAPHVVADTPRDPSLALRDALPRVDDVPKLLSEIQQAAIVQGLGWPQAEYRLHPATDDELASLEVRCTLKGPYPELRRFIATLLWRQPALTLREFSLSRAGSEAPQVEAKLSLGIYLAAPGTAPSAGAAIALQVPK
jgi:hypothetical protein